MSQLQNLGLVLMMFLLRKSNDVLIETVEKRGE